MRRFFLFIISLVFSPLLFAQSDSSVLIIENAIQSRKDVGRIIYLDSSLGFYKLISQVAGKGKIEGYRDTVKVVLTLSQQEIKFLDSTFKQTKPLAWRQHMFENSFMITYDSLKQCFDQSKGADYFAEKIAKKYFTFSDPIFIRNNSIAIFRLVEMYNPSAGHDLIYFYQRQSGKWQQYMHVVVGAW